MHLNLFPILLIYLFDPNHLYKFVQRNKRVSNIYCVLSFSITKNYQL